jgi:hypothetical protein
MMILQTMALCLQRMEVMPLISLGHQEYVTQKEYDNLKRFANGGAMLILDGNVIYTEVKYDL